ncbi:hypothetical protein B7486_74045, partial [cyanobacterium TDX16]
RRAGLSQRALAELAGVSPSTVARIERGRLEPTLDLLLRLVEAAGLQLRLVLAEDDGADRRQRERRVAMSVQDRITEAAEVAKLRGIARADA